MSDVHLIINITYNLKSTVQELSIKHIYTVLKLVYIMLNIQVHTTYVNT